MSATSPLPATVRTRRGPHLSGLTWLIWRQHRSAFWTGLVLLAVFAAFVVTRRSGMVADIDAHNLAGCVYESPEARCEEVNAFRGRFYDVMHYTGLLVSFVPLVIGVFLGGPLLSRELENGTYALSCTQSVSRTRWIAFKLGVPALVTLIGTSAVAALYTWWWQPADTLMKGMYWYESPFNNVGVVPVALSLLALVTGAAIGMVLRRPVAAMAVTCAVAVVGWVGVNVLRPLLWPVREVTVDRITADYFGSPIPLGHLIPNAWPTDLPNKSYSAWNLDSGYLTSSGDHFTSGACGDFTAASAKCLKAHDVVGAWAQYHPASHFWPMQWVMAGLLLAVTAAVTAFAVWWARHRA
ncbi:hypothetical protein [Streptomyces fructofermentans]|uniref:Transporter n=1 Tax=Streptomyces fructofermentans TaxID=152141 RepID=A0A918KBQ3_9ACTN|nr:hypothetical protein [Streptomyces fructofermentans]GGX56714.1 transporter [Streptomyces fructofermentans]